MTYHLNGGNNSESNANDNGKYKYTIESDEFEFKAPSRKNYTFEGWYADADFDGESVSALKKAHMAISICTQSGSWKNLR